MQSSLHSCFVLIFFLLSASVLWGQEEEKGGAELLRADAEGTHFIVGFLQNEENRSACALRGNRGASVQELRILSRTANTVTVNYPGGNTTQHRLSAMQVMFIPLNGEEYECLGEGICEKSIEILSESPVTVYCVSSKTHSTDGYLALPISSWGQEYVTVNYNLDHYTKESETTDSLQCSVEPRRGEFGVIAAEDNTFVTVYPATKTASGALAGVPIVKELRKGDIWQVQDGGKVRGGSDITGSRIVADKPVGLLSGHERTGMPWMSDTKDHLIEMLPPVESLGQRYIIVPFAGQIIEDLIRVVAVDGLTSITVTTPSGQTFHTLLGTGKFIELPVAQVTTVESNKPVLVSHYSQSSYADGQSVFDPTMIISSPTEQFGYSGFFHTMPNAAANPTTTKDRFNRHFLTLIVESQQWGTMRLNGRPLSIYPGFLESGVVHGFDSAYTWATFQLPENLVCHITGDALFSGYLYGTGQFNAYGWPIGVSPAKDSIAPDVTPPQFSTVAGCGGRLSTVTITDSAQDDYGIASIVLQSSSSNTHLEFVDAFVPGQHTVTVNVRVTEPHRSGNGSLIVEDMAGNRDTLFLEFEPIMPSFSQTFLQVSSLPLNTPKDELVQIRNLNVLPITLDSARLVFGMVVTMPALSPSGQINQIVEPGESYDLALRMQIDQSGTYLDTLIVTADCYEYRIPIIVTGGQGSVRVRDKDFGAVLVSEEKCLELPITNDGALNLTITDLQLEGPFTIDPSLPPTLPVELAPGQSLTLRICYLPQEKGEHIGTIWVTTSIGTVSAVLQGVGVDEVTSVEDEVSKSASVITVIRRGDLLELESHGSDLALRGVRLVALNGESILLHDPEQDGATRCQMALPSSLPSGLYYLRAEGERGESITAKVLIVR